VVEHARAVLVVRRNERHLYRAHPNRFQQSSSVPAVPEHRPRPLGPPPECFRASKRSVETSRWSWLISNRSSGGNRSTPRRSEPLTRAQNPRRVHRVHCHGELTQAQQERGVPEPGQPVAESGNGAGATTGIRDTPSVAPAKPPSRHNRKNCGGPGSGPVSRSAKERRRLKKRATGSPASSH
jgi:hypothetical protein